MLENKRLFVHYSDMANIQTREELTQREQAWQNLPTKERYAKGDIDIHGVDEDDSRKVAYPIAQVRRQMDRIERLVDSGTISTAQAKVCYFFRLCHYCAHKQFHGKVMSYDAEAAGQSVWVGHQQWLDYALSYHFMADPQRLPPKHSHIIHGIVVHEKAPREAVKCRHGHEKLYIREAVEALERAKKDLHNYNKNLQGTAK